MKKLANYIASALVFLTPYLVSQSDAAQNTPPQTVQSASSYNLRQSPTISAKTIDTVLEMNGSPAKGIGQFLHNMSIVKHQDSAYLLAIYGRESNYGTSGVAKSTNSWGNVRPGKKWKGAVYDAGKNGKFRRYASHRNGLVDLCDILNSQYVGRNTPEQIVPKYAPREDGNDVSGYVSDLKRKIDFYRSIESGFLVPVKQADGSYKVFTKSEYTGIQNGSLYVVQQGDSLSKISKKTGVSIANLKEFNRMRSNSLKAGQIIKIK